MKRLAQTSGLAILIASSSVEADVPIRKVHAQWVQLTGSTERAVRQLEQHLRTLATVNGSLWQSTQAHARGAVIINKWENDAPQVSDVGPTRAQVTATFQTTQHGPFDDLILRAANRWNLDPFLLKGLISNESKFEPLSVGKRHFADVGDKRVVISGGAIGIAQFTGGGIRAVNQLRKERLRRGDRTLGFDAARAMVPQEAIPAAAEFLAYLVRLYGRDGGITAYNAGVVSGQLVKRYGFWRARQTGQLSQLGIYRLQGNHFLLNVLKQSNWYRIRAGLTPLGVPNKNDHYRQMPPATEYALNRPLALFQKRSAWTKQPLEIQ